MNAAMASYAVANPSPPSLSVAARSPGADAVSRTRFLGHDVLGFLSEQDLSALLRWSTVRLAPRREVIYRQGDSGNTVTLVMEGYVKLSKTLADGREVVLEIIGPGGCFGEVAVINKWPHDADVTALSRCRLLAIDGRQFRQVLERKPEGMLTIMQLVSERLQRTTAQMVDALVLSAPARLAKALTQLGKLLPSGVSHGDGIRLRLSQSELGAMTGLTRESVNKYLGIWRDAGWILISEGSVTLIDVPALISLLPERPGTRI